MMLETDAARFLLGLMWQQLWIGSALVLLVGVCLRTVRRLNAATRHWIWALTLLTMALLPLAALLPAGPVSPAAVGIPERGLERAIPVADQRPTLAFPDEGKTARVGILSAVNQPMARPAATRVLATSLLMLWLAGTLWMLLGLFQSAKLAARLRRESREAPLPARQADIRLSALARTPMVVGLWRPTILIPLPLFEQVPRQELQRVLDHELAHVRRRDQWLMLLQKLIEALYFFHPAVRYAARRLDDEREISCDDRAARWFLPR